MQSSLLLSMFSLAVIALSTAHPGLVEQMTNEDTWQQQPTAMAAPLTIGWERSTGQRCLMCKMGVNQVLNKISADKLAPELNQLCEGLPKANNLQDMCKAGVAMGLPVVDSYLQTLNAEKVCTAAQMCKPNEFMPTLPTAKIPCPICKFTLNKALKALSPEELLKKIATGGCATVGIPLPACMLVAKAGLPLLKKLLKAQGILNSSTICSAVGSCPAFAASAAAISSVKGSSANDPSRWSCMWSGAFKCCIKGDKQCCGVGCLFRPGTWLAALEH